ncbi:MotA/TolQ/ExbB proton channel family protein [Thalassoglobus polymorphus]|uniref:Biopolymer transport protein ExbB n=1 Tax=Thalassoglobus polymorphus TaxID=2527994 RepID=A0A517QTZ3_9PLAN|nr:MotA/TolQ/ExbB proton channel family protein [Thalassoglobus polymorphus]QDT35110.1 Biopolymer transport protein ExbB [Thalassoglobus polymorphus]
MFLGRTRQRRLWQATTLLMLIMAMFVASTPSSSWAFQEAEAEPAAAEAAEPAAEPAPAGTEEESEEKNPANETFLVWMINASGAFGAVLLLISFIMVAVIMMNLLQVRRDNMLPEGFVAAFEEKLNAKDYQGAYEIARNDESLIARVLAAGLSRLNRGYEEAIEGMQEVGEEESMTMEHRLSYLALIGSVAPMIGLMGTVWGMIASFRTIATAPVAPKPKDLADGISTALFTTLEGLVVAIPAIIAYSLLRNRVSRLLLEVGRVSEGLMSRLPVGKSAE